VKWKEDGTNSSLTCRTYMLLTGCGTRRNLQGGVSRRPETQVTFTCPKGLFALPTQEEPGYLVAYVASVDDTRRWVRQKINRKTRKPAFRVQTLSSRSPCRNLRPFSHNRACKEHSITVVSSCARASLYPSPNHQQTNPSLTRHEPAHLSRPSHATSPARATWLFRYDAHAVRPLFRSNNALHSSRTSNPPGHSLDESKSIVLHKNPPTASCLAERLRL
jgi:hypothetical protein